MNMPQRKAKLLLLAGRAAAILCPVIILLVLSHFSLTANATSIIDNGTQAQVAIPAPIALSSYAAVDPQARSQIRAEVPTIPTVPTVPTTSGTNTATPPATSTATKTPTPLATSTGSVTPKPSPTSTGSVTPTPSPTSTLANPTVSYRIVFVNTTGKTIIDAKIEVTVPLYTEFNLDESTSGWTCPTGVGAGNKCQYHFGDVPPAEVASSAVHSATALEAIAVLNILKDQLPEGVQSINLGVSVVDGSGKVYATYNLTAQLPGGGETFLPLIRR